MQGTKPRKVYPIKEVKDYRELLKIVEEKYANKIAYKFKKQGTLKNPEYIEITYNTVVRDVKALATSLLSQGLENKKIVVIGNNRYEWCVTYLAVTTGNMVIVPLDKALPDNEIQALITRSEAEVVIFDKKYQDIMLTIKNSKENKVKQLICMDILSKKEKEETGIENYQDILEKGKKLVEEGNQQYDKIKIDSQKMSIMLFTSGTTNLPKAVMLSQGNICSNLSNFTGWVKIYPEDTLLSFLPIHHTFESTITFLYGNIFKKI